MEYGRQLVVPYPPSVNHCYVTVRQGTRLRQVLSAEAKRYQTEVAALAAEFKTTFPPDHKLVIEATYYKPDARRRDVINLNKVLADGLMEGFGVDDQWFLWRDMDFDIDRKDPRVELRIYAKED